MKITLQILEVIKNMSILKNLKIIAKYLLKSLYNFEDLKILFKKKMFEILVHPNIPHLSDCCSAVS